MSETLNRARTYEAARSREISPEERPLFHMTPRVGWMNDPNGFSLYRGEAHLFYQYHPYGTFWGPMHWGHVKTTDFLHWEYLPAALAPDRDYDRDGCFSGSGVELPDGRHLLMYTGHLLTEDGSVRQTQCLAVGDGLNYEKYEGNPVLTAADLPVGGSPVDFRDPKLWQEGSSFRAAVGNLTGDGSGAALLFRSEDGFRWEYDRTFARSRNEFGKMWECPDTFVLDGKQVLLISAHAMEARGQEFHNGNGTVCMVGHIDPETGEFCRENYQNIDYGLDFYAPQTMLTEDGRRILIGWMQSWESCGCQPEGAKWFGMMTLPRELSIREGRLIQQPVRELESLRRDPVFFTGKTNFGCTEIPGVSGRTVDLTVRVRPKEVAPDYLEIRVASDGEHYTDILYRPQQRTLEIDRSYSGFPHDIPMTRRIRALREDGVTELRVILDRFSVEVFVNGGEQVLSSTIYTDQRIDGIQFFTGRPAEIEVEKYTLG